MKDFFSPLSLSRSLFRFNLQLTNSHPTVLFFHAPDLKHKETERERKEKLEMVQVSSEEIFKCSDYRCIQSNDEMCWKNECARAREGERQREEEDKVNVITVAIAAAIVRRRTDEENGSE